MSSKDRGSLGGKIVSTVGVGLICLVAADVMLWSTDKIDVSAGNPLSLSAGGTTEREFTVTAPGTPHLITLAPHTNPSSSPISQDARYAFQIDADVLDPDGQSVQHYADEAANHLDRGIEFTPATAGTYVVQFRTSKGDQRADLFVVAKKGSAILSFLRRVTGL